MRRARNNRCRRVPAGEPHRTEAPNPPTFAAWRAGFHAGIGAGDQPGDLRRGLRRRGRQCQGGGARRAPAEFTKPIWDYLDSAASPTRVATGRAEERDRRRSSRRSRRAWRRQRRGCWRSGGMETNFAPIAAIFRSSRAWRRSPMTGGARALPRNSWIDALKILQSGDVAPQGMVGSWAGAMGHTQFMPSSLSHLCRRFHRRWAARRLVERPDRRLWPRQ